MKSILSFVSVFALVLLFAGSTATAQERGREDRPSPNASVSQDIGTTTVSVTYGRPGLKGRTLESLAPSGSVWRTGANEATTITFSTDVVFGGEEVPAGTYTLFTIPGETWTFILNDQLEANGRPTWGAYSYDESRDVARAEAAVTTTDAPNAEWFTIFFDALSSEKAHLNLHWGTTLAAIPVEVK